MGRTLLSAALAGIAGLAVFFAAPGVANAESNGGVRIMPLGDSITDGFNVPGGYRTGLWQSLVAGGHTIDFVGTGFNGPASLGDHDHEGHSGWRIDQLDANIAAWLALTTPRTVLLHIGTNDMNQNFDIANAPARLSALIDHINTLAPSTEVFVATVTPESDPVREARVRTFNAQIPGIVSQKANAGRRVHLVDMHAALTTADLADGVHPNAGGYDKMARVWNTALLSVPGALSRPVGAPIVLRNPQSGRCLDVSGAVNTIGARTVIFDCSGNANQQWTQTAAGELRVYGNRCLDVFGGVTTAGAPAVIWSCGGSSQRWALRPDGSIVGIESGLCLEVAASATANAARVQIFTCNGTGAQKWAIR
jgi:lysophospholipase L1-like esterase